jgi:uncharacterized membrane protein YfcA
MSVLAPLTYAFLAAASFVAGAMNAIAGGGTLITFPTLLGAGISPVVANATSTISLVPGSLAGAYGFRAELRSVLKAIKLFAIPAIIGGLVGAKLMLWGGDELLGTLVPWLILGASGLFLLQEPISRWLARRDGHSDKAVGQQNSDALQDNATERLYKHAPIVIVFMFIVAVYGGYFGAGMGILTLAALGFMGFRNIHQMNALKNILAASINLVATITFILAGRIDWLVALIMTTGAVLGGLSGATLALRVGQKAVRRTIIIIGFSIAAFFFWRQYHS